MANRLTVILIAAAVTFVFALPLQAGESTAGTKIGVLTCKSIPGTGLNLLIHSTVDVKCKFDATDRSSTEHYIGETGIGLGLDISHKTKQTMVFTVFAADSRQGNHKLAGKYIGASASATVGAGLGAHVLVGQGKNSVSLQPAIEGNQGIGASAGLSYLYLQADK